MAVRGYPLICAARRGDGPAPSPLLGCSDIAAGPRSGPSAALTMPVALVRCRQPFRDGFVVPDAVAAEIASTVPTLTRTDVDADHFTVMTHPPAAEALGALLV